MAVILACDEGVGGGGWGGGGGGGGRQRLGIEKKLDRSR